MISWLWVTTTTTTLLSLLLLEAVKAGATTAHNATNSRTGLTVTADQRQQQRTVAVVLGAKISERLTADADYYAATANDDWHLWPSARPDAPPSSASERLFSRRNVDHQVALNQQASRKRPIYTNQFVIKVKGGEGAARQIAQRHGFVYLNHILDDYYHLENHRLAKRSPMDNSQVALNLTIQEEPEVLQLERQVLKRRVKRDFLELSAGEAARQRQQQQQPPTPTWPANQAPSGQRGPQRPSQVQQQQQQQLLRPAHQYTRPANQAPARRPPVGQQRAQEDPRTMELLETAASSAQLMHQQAASGGRAQPSNPLASVANSTAAKSAPFNDPSWPLMWYLDGGARNGFDLNVREAWKMGYTGRNIVITILDDGLEKDHPDLAANYDPWASFDINGDDADPMPRYDTLDSNRHGTRCAGEVAAVPDNNICSIGIAYNSKVGGVRMLDGEVTDAVEARSLSLNNQYIHIYSASWGPDDNGKTVDGPGEMATRAFIEGVTNGRQGLGSIFVFASGNGGREHDNCNCDGYTNSIWTLSISSATENGNVPWYIEACSSTLATTYSSGSYEERQIATTDLHHSCTSSHTGTSASAPLAAGICALVLESNPRLTWRDMQHIVVRTARPANLVAKDWRANGLGRNVSHAFGYGLMDAAAMIHLARRWTTVPVQYTCEVRSPPMERFIPAKGYIELKLNSSCDKVRFLEHVQSKVTLASSRRGDLHIYLVSPHGTRSTLLAQRPNDHAEQGFRNWPFMTVHNWGESPNGVWTLEVHNDGKPQNRAFLKEWTLILYGTNDDPNRHLDSQPTSRPASPVGQPARPPPPMPPIGSPVRAQADVEQVGSSPPLLPPPSPPPPPPPPQPAQQPAFKPQSQWTFQGRPQPAGPTTLAPPTSTGSSVTSTSSSSSSSTSSTSYLSTFKTSLVSDGSLQPAKADFEVVSPVAGMKPAATGQPAAAGAETNPPPVSSTAQLPSLVTTSAPASVQANLSQPNLMMKPSVEVMQQQPPQAGTQNNELEQQDNQMDSAKLNKEYRSSGDQSSTGYQSSSSSSHERRPQVSGEEDRSNRVESSSASCSSSPTAAVIIGAMAAALSLSRLASCRSEWSRPVRL